MLHTPYLYWMHKIHHEHKYPIYLDAYHGHWFESPFQSLGFFVPFLFMDVGIGTFLAFIVVNVRGMLHHDKRGEWIMGNHHLLHHEYGHGNYGMRWIDYCCGTDLKLPSRTEGLF